MAALHGRADYGQNIIQNLRGALTFDCGAPLMSTRSRRVQSETGSRRHFQEVLRHLLINVALHMSHKKKQKKTRRLAFQASGWLISLSCRCVILDRYETSLISRRPRGCPSPPPAGPCPLARTPRPSPPPSRFSAAADPNPKPLLSLLLSRCF